VLGFGVVFYKLIEHVTQAWVFDHQVGHRHGFVNLLFGDLCRVEA
jgi:hypothetical protein